MGWSIPYGFRWQKLPDGTTGLVKDESGAGEFGEGSGTTYSSRDNVIAAPPPMGEEDLSENIYRDQGVVIRNRNPSVGGARAGAMGPPTSTPDGSYATSTGGASYGGGDGGGGRQAGASNTGTVSSADRLTQALQTIFGGGGGGWGTGQQSQSQGYGNTIPGGSTSTFSSSGGGISMPSLGGSQMAGASQYSINTANANAGAMTAVGNELAGINPQVGQMDRTLYDQYAGFLSKPEQMLNNPIVAAALQKAQQAAGRQLSAGRMSRSGNAAQAISEATGQTMLGQYYNIAQTLGGGAQQEQARWGMQTGAGLDAARIRAGALGAAGQVYGGAGTLGLQAGTAEAANVSNEELERMRRAQFIGSMTGDPYKGLQAGQFGTMTQQQGVTQGRPAGMFDPGYAGTTYTMSTFNLRNAYGGMNSMPSNTYGSGRLL